ncbi:protein SON [Nephila pilipes]|uniref:Protein SON n=1 Tax=Nephila pilipes TaxID=299642 RepID=A0A8X6M8T9_NEPPI|nr:protein SON [Nephila pilipes]
MSLVEENGNTDDEDVNIEGILADFFLKKIGMKSSKSDSDGRHKKKSKHKKHKSKKHKHKSSKRSSSIERIKYSNNLDLGHTSSSEEKEIKRLKKIKKLDGRDSQKFNAYLPISLSAQNILSSKETDIHNSTNTSVGIDVPYGPSLELLLTGTETTRETESKTLRDISLPEQKDESLGQNLSKLSKEPAEYEVSNKVNCLELETSKLADKSVIIEEIECKEHVVASNAENACINEPLNMSQEFVEATKVIDTNINSDKPKIESDFKNEKKHKENSSKSRSRSLSKSRKPKNFRSRSRSKRRSRSKSRPKRHSRSISRSKRGSRSISRSKKHSRSWSRSKRHSRSRSKLRHRTRSRTRRSRSNYRSCKRSYSRDYSVSPRQSRSRTRRYRSRSKETFRRKGIRKSRSHSRSLGKRRRSRSYSKDRIKPKYDNRSRSRSKSGRHHSRSSSGEHSNPKSKRESSYSSKSLTERTSSESKSRLKRNSRSKSKEKESSAKSCKIDQAKILEIAQKNVLNMIEQGTLPVGIPLEHFKKKELVSIKSGGKSVQELTDFCAKLSKKENEVNDEPNNTIDVGNKDGDTGFIHHPFKLKEQSMIKLNIKNAVQIPVKTHAEKFAETAKLSSQFPVSSGNQHKQKELEWIPVVTDSSKRDLKVNSAKTVTSTIPAVPELKNSVPEVAKCAASIDTFTSTTNSVSFIPLPSTSPLPSLSPPPLPPTPMSFPPLPPPPPLPPLVSEPQFTSSQIMLSNDTNSQLSNVNLPSTSLQSVQPVIPLSLMKYPMPSYTNNLSMSTICSGLVPSTANQEPFSKAYSAPNPKKQFDIASVLSKKLKAQQKLQEDPNNAEALQAIQDTQATVQEWVRSCEVPGMFYGSTHVKLLTPEQLSGPRDYRVKRDALTLAAPVTEGKGMSLLKKMGWNPGEGLGKNKEGSLVPLMLDIKMDKKGLVSEGESGKSTSNAVKELQGKHPVSALMELCSKRKWKPPLYTIIKDIGPPHKKLFLFKVEVNGVEYQPVMPSSNKKIAKADAAIVCLQTLKVYMQ